MYTEEKIKSKSDAELAELLGGVNYDRLGFANGEFYVMLNPFSKESDFEPVFFPVDRYVVEEYLCRLLVEDYEPNPLESGSKNII
jgi:hypothetical protein